MDEEEETVLLSFSFSEKRDWAAEAGISGTSGNSGISKDSADHSRTNKERVYNNNNNFIYIALLKTMFTKCFDRTKQEKQFSFHKEK